MKIVLITLLLVSTLYAQQLTAATVFDTLSVDLPKKYCPMRNFDGLPFCPIKPRPAGISALDGEEPNAFVFDTPDEIKLEILENAFNKTESKDYANLLGDDRIISGFGYDRAKRTIKFPVLGSTQPVTVSKVENVAKKFNNANEFLGHVMNKEKKTFEAGLYTHDDRFIQDFAMKFGEYDVSIGVTQGYHHTHTTNIQSKKPLEEFQDVIDGLPKWDPKNPVSRNYYNNIIHFWGTDAATATIHGGVVYQQTAIKTCYGGSVTADMIKDLEAAMKKVPPGNLAYLRYRKLGIFQARGGNPEYGMDKVKERIASFKKLPAPIKFNVIPLWELVKDETKKQWLKAAIEHYLNENTPNVNNIIAKVNAEKQRRYKLTNAIQYQVFNVEQFGNFAAYWKGCPLVRLRGAVYAPHCTLLQPAHPLAASQRKLVWNWPQQSYQVYLERNPTTGYTRVISYHRGNVHRVSNWVQKGCANIVGPYNVLYFSFCMDCLPIIQQKAARYNQKHTILNCVCKSF